MSQFVFHSARYPVQPGCYIMKDTNGAVLYVGKSKNLRDRLSSYFGHSAQKDGHTRNLVSQVSTIELVLVNSETESLLLENVLIGRFRPPFNRLYARSYRSYPSIALTDERFPRLVPYQEGHPNREVDSTPLRQLFGPYVSHRFCQAVLDFVVDHFRLRTCQPLSKEICLRYHIHKCSGACAGRIDEANYARDVEAAVVFLSTGLDMELVRQMRAAMQQCADNLLFEQAQRLKAQIALLEEAFARQVIIRDVRHDQDFIYFGEGQALLAATRHGVLYGIHFLSSLPEDDLSRFSGFPAERIANQLTQPGEQSIPVRMPHGEDEEALVELCRLNYEYRVSQQGLPA